MQQKSKAAELRDYEAKDNHAKKLLLELERHRSLRKENKELKTHVAANFGRVDDNVCRRPAQGRADFSVMTKSPQHLPVYVNIKVLV